MSKSERLGHLFIIGGSEERRGDMRVLERYIELCGGPRCSIAVLTSASTKPDDMWDMYGEAFGELGVRRCFPIAAESRDEADDSERARRIFDADGIFMSGGTQKRLVEILGGTRIHDAMRRAFVQRAACIGGTSAGASAMARHMLERGTKDKLPVKHTSRLESGLNFLQNVVIDQHFSERQRLARLLSAIAKYPDLIGVGIDEDTALIVSGSGHMEVVGAGAVTLLDGRHMSSNIGDVGSQDLLELVNVVLHLLPAGNRYDTVRTAPTLDGAQAKEALIDVLRLVGRIQP